MINPSCERTALSTSLFVTFSKRKKQQAMLVGVGKLLPGTVPATGADRTTLEGSQGNETSQAVLTAALFPGKLKKASGPYFWGTCFNTDRSLPAWGGYEHN